VQEETGVVIEAEDYDAWGVAMTGRSYLSGVGAKEGYTGKERDAETGLDYFGARYYLGAIGRWGGVDALTDQYPSWSPYTYVLNSPLRLVDPDGMRIIDDEGNPVTFTINADGTLSWSNNATNDIIRVGNAMAKSSIGLNLLKALVESKYDITINIEEAPPSDLMERNSNLGESYWGFTEASVSSTNKIKFDVYVFERNIFNKWVRAVMPPPRTVLFEIANERIAYDSLEPEDLMGGVAVHEATHVVDPQSSRLLSPNSLPIQREKNPDHNQIMHYHEVKRGN
jgi:RHS repeat-associated protein